MEARHPTSCRLGVRQLIVEEDVGAQGAGGQPVVITLTASAFAEDHERYFEAGMDDYLGKPVRSEDFAGAPTGAAATLDRRAASGREGGR